MQAAHHAFATQANQAFPCLNNWKTASDNAEAASDKGKAEAAVSSLTATATATASSAFSTAELSAIYNSTYSKWRAAENGHRLLKAVIMCGTPRGHESPAAHEGDAEQREPAGHMGVASSNGAPTKHLDHPRLLHAVCLCSEP